MARYEHLPLFKAVYDFNLYFFRLSKGFPKDFKYGLAQEIRSLTTGLMDLVILANNSGLEKDLHLRAGEVDIERIKIKIRMLSDLKVMNIKSYGYSSGCLVDISKQIVAWRNWAEKQAG